MGRSDEGVRWRKGVIVMFAAKRYTIFLEVGNPNGSQWLCELSLEPIGSSAIEVPASFWTQLLRNLAARPLDTKLQEELDSLQNTLPKGQYCLCDVCCGKKEKPEVEIMPIETLDDYKSRRRSNPSEHPLLTKLILLRIYMNHKFGHEFEHFDHALSQLEKEISAELKEQDNV